MATTTGAGRRTEKKSTTAAKPDVVDTELTSKAETKKMPTVVEIPLTDLVCVQSCFYGDLIYVSKKSGDVIEWNEFGSEQYLSVQELLYMRNTQPAFFRNQWIRFIGDNADEAFNFLHLERYCKNRIDFDDFNELFSLSEDEIEDVVSSYSASMKESIARFTIEQIENKTLDNLSTIRALQKATGYELLK